MLDGLVLPARLSALSGPLVLRGARENDVDVLMALLADDPISAARGDTADGDDRAAYLAALLTLRDDPANALLLATGADGSLLATMQLTRIPGMARRGSTRLLVEAVRVRSDQRSTGIGAAIMRWVTDVAARDLECDLVQLTSDAARTSAHRFYEGLGFVPSHIGFKYRVTV